MKTITIPPAEFLISTENLFLLVKNDRPFSANEVIELTVQEESFHSIKNTTRLFRISDTMKYHPGIRHSYVVLFLKPYKVPFWVIIKHFFSKILRFFSTKKKQTSGKKISIRPIPNNRSDNNFRRTQITRSRKGKIRNIKIKSKKI